MQLHTPDPAFSQSVRARHNFRLALKLSLAFVALLWLVFLADGVLGFDLRALGVRPRTLQGLSGIILAPLLHGGFSHLIANSAPLVVLGTGMLYLYPSSAFKVIPLVYFGANSAVWLLARPGVHIGASGLVYGLAAYIFAAGLIRRDRRAVAAAMLVYFLYGTLAWGIVPSQAGLSWETHLAAALIGLALAVYFRHSDIPPRKRYAWEDEDNEDNEDNAT